MCSTPKERAPIVVSLALAAAAVCGCSTISNSKPVKHLYRPRVEATPGPLAAQPVPDEATELRGWNRSVAYWHNGTVLAWSTRWPYEPNPDYTSRVDFVVDPVMLIVQTVILPVELVKDPPGKKIYYRDEVVPPSYTANPPYPPSKRDVRDARRIDRDETRRMESRAQMIEPQEPVSPEPATQPTTIPASTESTAPETAPATQPTETRPTTTGAAGQ